MSPWRSKLSDTKDKAKDAYYQGLVKIHPGSAPAKEYLAQSPFPPSSKPFARLGEATDWNYGRDYLWSVSTQSIKLTGDPKDSVEIVSKWESSNSCRLAVYDENDPKRSLGNGKVTMTVESKLNIDLDQFLKEEVTSPEGEGDDQNSAQPQPAVSSSDMRFDSMSDLEGAISNRFKGTNRYLDATRRSWMGRAKFDLSNNSDITRATECFKVSTTKKNDQPGDHPIQVRFSAPDGSIRWLNPVVKEEDLSATFEVTKCKWN